MASCKDSIFDFRPHETVLFLGEGNFSFSNCLLNQIKYKFGVSNFKNVYVTCYQNEISPDATSHVNQLKNLGAEILLGIDATKLEIYQEIRSKKFNKIIFNFPHVGGKMKINLNRELLRNFFTSASIVMEISGEVFVTLCCGQGGTGFDIISRKWNDSWQIVEQAAYGDFILSQTEFFPVDMYADYKPVGYRGLDKVFNIESSVIHRFCKVKPINCSLPVKELRNFLPVTEDLLVSPVHKFAIENDPFSRINSPQSFVKRIFENSVKSFCSSTIVLNLCSSCNIDFNLDDAPCIFKGRKNCLRSSLFQVIPPIGNENFFSHGLVFKKCSSDFTDFCSRCECIATCSVEMMQNFIHFIIWQLKFSKNVSVVCDDENQWALYFLNEKLMKNKIAWGNPSIKTFYLDVDALSSYAFDVPIKQLWSPGLEFDSKTNLLIFPSLYSLEYSFDVSLASNKELNFDDFYYLLHQLPENIIESVNLLSTYELSDSSEISYCFRLIYRSFSKPLNRKIAIKFHDEVVGKSIVNVLGVRIR